MIPHPCRCGAGYVVNGDRCPRCQARQRQDRLEAQRRRRRRQPIVPPVLPELEGIEPNEAGIRQWLTNRGIPAPHDHEPVLGTTDPDSIRTELRKRGTA